MNKINVMCNKLIDWLKTCTQINLPLFWSLLTGHLGTYRPSSKEMNTTNTGSDNRQAPSLRKEQDININ
jgi:hypothetical protein